MFFLSVTREPSVPSERVPDAQPLMLGDWHGRLLANGEPCPRDEGVEVLDTRVPGVPSMGYHVRAQWDREGRRLTIERPFSAHDPCYYHLGADGSVYVASRIDMLRRAGVAIAEDAARVPELFAFRCVVPPATLYRGIRQLAPGDRLELRRGEGGWHVEDLRRFPFPRPAADGSASEMDEARRTLAGLERTVGALEPVASSVALLFSGGIDSTTLYTLANRLIGANETYGAGYPFAGEQDPELLYARSATRALGNNYHHIEPTVGEYLEGLIHGIGEAEEPLIHLQSVLLRAAFRHGIPAERSVVINGQGAGQFSSGRLERRLRSLRQGSSVLRLLETRPASWVLEQATNRLGKGKTFAAVLAGHGLSEDFAIDPGHTAWRGGFESGRTWASDYFGVSDADLVATRYEAMTDYLDRPAIEVGMLVETLANTTTSGVWGKLATAAGRVLYDPFTEQDMPDIAWSTPLDVRMKSYKHVLKLMQELLEIPEFIRRRPKLGFGLDLEYWANRGAAFEPFVPFAVREFGEREVRRAQSTETSRAYTFWNMINYSIWKRVCIEGASPSEVAGELAR